MNAVRALSEYSPAAIVMTLDFDHDLLIEDQIVRSRPKGNHRNYAVALGHNLWNLTIAVDLI